MIDGLQWASLETRLETSLAFAGRPAGGQSVLKRTHGKGPALRWRPIDRWHCLAWRRLSKLCSAYTNCARANSAGPQDSESLAPLAKLVRPPERRGSARGRRMIDARRQLLSMGAPCKRRGETATVHSSQWSRAHWRRVAAGGSKRGPKLAVKDWRALSGRLSELQRRKQVCGVPRLPFGRARLCGRKLAVRHWTGPEGRPRRDMSAGRGPAASSRRQGGSLVALDKWEVRQDQVSVPLSLAPFSESS